jgi:hypothetical protein
MQLFLISWQWLLSFGLATWFLFVHSPPVLKERGAYERTDFFIHLAGAYVVYIACLHNTFFNPFLLRRRHALVGQVGLLCGTVGFLFGLVTIYTTWHEIDRGFAIGITVGGILQMQLQYRGYRAIQEYKQVKEELQRMSEEAGATNDKVHVQDGAEPKAGNSTAAASSSCNAEQEDEDPKKRRELLRQKQGKLMRTHVGCMVALLVNACGMPAAMRLVVQLGLGSGVPPLVFAVGLLSLLKASHARAIYAQLFLDDGGKKKD